jgi:heme exporter protein D
VHRSLNDSLQDPANTSQSLRLRARQRVILHDLRRRARRRARLRPGTNEPSTPGA